MEDVIRVDQQVYVLAGSSRLDVETRVLKHDDAFAVFDRHGDIANVGVGELGLYHADTRFLSRLELYLNRQRPLLLNSGITQDTTQLYVDLTNPDLYEGHHLAMPRGTLHLRRLILLYQGVCYQELEVVNFGADPVSASLEWRVETDFADIFEVRGAQRSERPQPEPPALEAGRLLFRYTGKDGVVRRTVVAADPPPDQAEPDRLLFALNLAPHERARLRLTIACEAPDIPAPVLSHDEAVRGGFREMEAARADDCRIFTSNEQFNEWLNRSAADLHMLTTATPHGAYPYAGIPWFSAPFGRDGILAALQYLWVNPDLARGVLGYLAATQAREENPAREAEPGKVLHETRKGEMAALGEVPLGCYYGTVDATPLFVVLAGAYFYRTGDQAFIERLWPQIQAALAWIDRYGDLDGDGFVEYRQHSPTGLVNQGWKDSDDAIQHADGSLARGAIALCEVQGYVYAARRAGAELAALMGDRHQAERLRQEEDELKRRFNRTFWDEELEAYILALDGDKRPCRVLASNAGHALFSGIAEAGHAQRLARRLLSEQMFSGWGVRTLASSARGYNPMSYHNGSVWPHDNALIAMGLARYGYQDAALAILRGLFEASLHLDQHRMPELFCGFSRRERVGPTLYPVACLPQAWSAAAAFYLLQAVLGLRFHWMEPRLRFIHPVMPDFLEWIELRNLRVGDGRVDLMLRRHPNDVGINVLRKDGQAEVAVIV